MRENAYAVVDVFADASLQGNALAVFPDAANLDGDSMQRIARETNLSETTFVTGGSPTAGYDVRIFTPAMELAFAGHPTLGTAAVISPGRDVTLSLGVGAVPVVYDARRDLYWLTAPPVTMGQVLDQRAVLAITGLNAGDLDADFPPERVCSGPSFLFVPLATLDALKRCAMDLARYRQFFSDDDMPNIYAFARGAHSAGFDMTCRLFFDAGGVREDPATGSAAACFGRYALERNYFGADEVDVCLSQGAWMQRPSRLYVHARAAAPGPIVRVGGQVHSVAAGTWRLP